LLTCNQNLYIQQNIGVDADTQTLSSGRFEASQSTNRLEPDQTITTTVKPFEEPGDIISTVSGRHPSITNAELSTWTEIMWLFFVYLFVFLV